MDTNEKFQVLADDGIWHDITGADYASYRLDGVPAERLRKVPADTPEGPA